MNKYTGQARLALLVFFLLFTGCQSITVEGGYTPPGIPVRVSIDSNGQLKFTAESNVELPTPLGTFDVGLVIEPIVYFGVENALTVRYNGQDHFYNLHGQDFNITFESGCYKDIKFSKTNNNLFLELARSCDGNDNIQSSYQIIIWFLGIVKRYFNMQPLP